MRTTKSKMFTNLMRTALFALVFVIGTASASFAGYQNFTFINNSSVDVCYIYASPSSDSGWGSDRAPASSCIAPGASFYVEIDGYPNADIWDIKLEGANNSPLNEIFGVDLSVVYEVIYLQNGSIRTR